MRNISFFLTQQMIINRTKTVTRRQGWGWLTPGTQLQPVEKGQGLKKGDKVRRIGRPIVVTAVDRVPLDSITEDDVVREGFPGMTPQQFVQFYCKHNRGCEPGDEVTRIEFQYA